MRRYAVVGLGLLLGLAAAWAGDDSATLPATQAGTQRITSHPQGQPVIALWNDGAHLANIKPFLLFAAWEDGTVLRRGEVGKPMGGAKSLHDWAAGKLTIGLVKPSDVLTLQAAIAKAGFFRPPLGDGLRFADGPSQSLCVRYGKAHRLLSHHGPSDKWLRESIETMGPTSSPTREDAEAFAAMWEKVTGLIDAVTPTNTTEFRDQQELTRPEPFEATDENGNPSVAYWGIPEHKERKAHIGTPRSVTTMTTVQVLEREKYIELKSAGKVRNEEQHGDWLYFATSGTVQIPNDTGYMELITRYKALVPASQSATQAATQPDKSSISIRADFVKAVRDTLPKGWVADRLVWSGSSGCTTILRDQTRPTSPGVHRGNAALCILPRDADEKPGAVDAGDITLKGVIRGITRDTPWGAVISGRVADEDKKPLAGVRVEVRYVAMQAAATDAEGRFRLEGLPEIDEPLNLFVTHKNYASKSTNIKPGTRDVEVELFPPGYAMFGKPAPELSVAKWLNSEPLELKNLRGKVVLLYLGLRADYPDQPLDRDAALFADLPKKYADKGLVVIGVHRDLSYNPKALMTEDRIAAFLKEYKVAVPFAIDQPYPKPPADPKDLKEFEGATCAAYQLKSTPAMILIDRAGVVRCSPTSANVNEWVDKLLAEPAADKTDKDTVEIHDVVEVDVLGQPDLKRRERVRADGKITLRLLGDVHVLGLTPLQVEEKLAKLYSEYIVGAKVTVKPITGQPVDIHVRGAVSREGPQLCKPGMTVLDAIAAAGGPTLGADLKAIQIRRDNKMWKVNLGEVLRGGNKEKDILLEPGDIVFVPLRDSERSRSTTLAALDAEKTTAVGSPWGEAVEGVQVRLVADRLRWKSDETPTFKAEVRNTGKREFFVAQTQQLAELEVDGKWYRWAGAIGVKSSSFPPGRHYRDIAFTLDALWQCIESSGARKHDLDLRVPGKHTVRVAFMANAANEAAGANVRAESNPVEIEILPAQAK